MSTFLPADPLALQKILGRRVQRLRLNKNLSQAAVAALAGVSERAWRNLENGNGSTLETLLRGLQSLGALSMLDGLLKEPAVAPGEVRLPRRASRQRASGTGAS